jgi:hypothetical protein
MATLLTEYSLWYLLPCILLGIFYTFLLYTKEHTWSKTVNRVLAVLRFVLVTLIAALLLGPYIKRIINEYEKPLLVLAIDNSQSIRLVKDTVAIQKTLKALDELSQKAADNNFEVVVSFLKEPNSKEASISKETNFLLQNTNFNAVSTDLSTLIKNTYNTYENQNLAGIVLLSDGIYNQGISPDFLTFPTPIYTVGIGDTVPKEDVNLIAVYSNKIAYLGNKFPLTAEIVNLGFAGKKTNVTLKKGETVIAQKEISFNANGTPQTVEFFTLADEIGTQHYVIEVTPLNGEFTRKNNIRNVYIDVLDGKEKILLVAPAPHPDIKAIKSAIERNENYQLQIYIPALTQLNQITPLNLEDKFDLVIFYQVPNAKNIATDVLQKLEAKPMAKWYILGNQSNLILFSQKYESLKITTNSLQKDKVTAVYNPNFDKFHYEEENTAVIAKFPPLSVPFGDYKLSPNTQSILWQRVGTVKTEKPLLTVTEKEGVKSAVLVGEGIWQWRQQNYQLKQNHEAFDILFSKIVQYLSSKEDKRKFRSAPIATEYTDADDIIFETEVYNDIYEQTTGHKIDLKITNSKGVTTAYSYMNSTKDFRYNIGNLPQGVYKYNASTLLNGKKEEVEGRIVVKEIEYEALNTTANFGLLRNVATQSGGDFYTHTNIAELSKRLTSQEYPQKIHTQESFDDLLNLPWLLALLCVLVSAEWLIRKIHGGY